MAIRTAILRTAGGGPDSTPLAGVKILESVGDGKSWVQVEDAYTRLWMAGRYMVVDDKLIETNVVFPDFGEP